MTSVLAQWEISESAFIRSPWTWAFLLGVVSLWLIVPRGRVPRWQRAVGGIAGVVALGIVAAQMPIVPDIGDHILFWLLAAITVIAAGAMISVRNPVYSAIWFAQSLLGTASLFLFQGAQLLGVATIVVYAGAIVVMFLFLIMLAQPDGHEYYDRTTWGAPAALVSAVAGAAVVLVLTTSLLGYYQTQSDLRSRVVALVTNNKLLEADHIRAVRVHQAESDELQIALVVAADAEIPAERALRDSLKRLAEFRGRPLEDHHVRIVRLSGHGTQASAHVATFGGVLFSRYLIAVEIAGTLLLIALVGAVAIIMYGRQQDRRRSEAVV
jgi:NADH-quinone oxidoreductase subunit J